MDREMTSETEGDLDEEFESDVDEETDKKIRDLGGDREGSFFDETEEWTEHGDGSYGEATNPTLPTGTRGTISAPPKASPAPARNALQVMLSWNFWVDGWLRWLFVHWAKVVVRFPVLLLLLTLLLFGGLGAGVLLREDGGDDASLWLSDDNRYTASENFWKQTFAEHEERIIVTAKKPDDYGANLLNNTVVNTTHSNGEVMETSYLKEVYALHTLLYDLSVSVLPTTRLDVVERNFTLLDLCTHTDASTCQMFTVVDYWKGNETAMLSDKDPRLTVNKEGITSFFQPLLTKAVVGGLTYLNDTLVQATAFRTIFYLDSSSLSLPYQAGLEKWENALEDALSKFEDSRPLLSIDHMIQSSGEELLKEAHSDEPYLFIGLSLMFIFLSLFLFSFDCIASKVLRTCAGIIHVIVAAIASTGVCGFLSIISTPLSPTLYVMIAAIGITHLLLLVHAFERAFVREQTAADERARSHNRARIAEARRGGERSWVSAAMAESLPPISVECVASISAFVAISVSSDPGFRAFGQQAAICVATEYLLLISFFCSCLVLDSRRIASHRADILPCIACVPDIDSYASEAEEQDPIIPKGSEQDASNLNESDQSSINSITGRANDMPSSSRETPEASFMEMILGNSGQRGSTLLPLIKKVFAPVLLYPPIKILCVLCLFGLLGVGIYGIMGYKQQFARADLYSADSAPHQYLGLEEDLFPEAPCPVTIVSKSIPYSDPSLGASLEQLMKSMLSNTQIVPDSSFPWYLQFLKFLRASPKYNSTLHNGFPQEKDFYPYLNDFLSSPRGSFYCGSLRSRYRLPLTSPCSNFSETSNPIIASRFHPFSVPLLTLDNQIDSIEALYAITDNYPNVPSFPFTQNYAFYMTFPEMESSWKMYLILAFAVVFIVTFVGIDVVSCLAVMTVFSLVYVALIGVVMHFSIPSIPISQLSLAAIIVTTAMSVNYSIHVAHEFMLLRGSRKERMERTLGTIGYSITASFLCTFLGSFVGLFVESTIYRTFVVMFISSQVLSWGHSFILIPAILSAVGVDNPA